MLIDYIAVEGTQLLLAPEQRTYPTISLKQFEAVAEKLNYVPASQLAELKQQLETANSLRENSADYRCGNLILERAGRIQQDNNRLEDEVRELKDKLEAVAKERDEARAWSNKHESTSNMQDKAIEAMAIQINQLRDELAAHKTTPQDGVLTKFKLLVANNRWSQRQDKDREIWYANFEREVVLPFMPTESSVLLVDGLDVHFVPNEIRYVVGTGKAEVDLFTRTDEIRNNSHRSNRAYIVSGQFSNRTEFVKACDSELIACGWKRVGI
jgi:hypothetical protein